MMITSTTAPRRLDRAGASAVLHCAEGHVYVDFCVDDHTVPVAERAALVEEVLDSREVLGSSFLHATAPLGDSEIVLGLQARCPALRTRAAGSTCLIEADLDGVR